jgi:hypothetical protein
VEVVRLHRQLEAAKNKVREGTTTQRDATQQARNVGAAAPERLSASEEVEGAEERIQMDLDDLCFEGAEFDEADLPDLEPNDAPEVKRAKTASWFQTQTRKRLHAEATITRPSKARGREASSGFVRASISKINKTTM